VCVSGLERLRSGGHERWWTVERIVSSTECEAVLIRDKALRPDEDWLRDGARFGLDLG
jgi:hypothetical protein